jgi:hypothetical protein
MEHRLDSTGSGQTTMAGSFDHGNKSAVSIKDQEYLE